MSAVGALVPSLLAVMVVLAIGLPATGLTTYFCMYVLDQWASASLPFFAQRPWLINTVVALIVFLSVFCAWMKEKNLRLIGGAVHVSVIAFLLYAAISITWSPVPKAAMQSWINAGPKLLIGVLFVPILITSTKDLYRALNIFVVVALMILSGIMLFADWSYRSFTLPEGTGEEVRLPLALAVFCGLAFLTSLLMTPHKGLSRMFLLARIVVAVLAVVVCFRTGSRGQLLAMIAALMIFLPLSLGYKHGRGLFAGILLVPIGILVIYLIAFANPDLFFVGHDSHRWSVEKLNLEEGDRLAMSLRLLDVWMHHPSAIFIGLGNSASFDPNILGIYPHNVYVEVLAEEGFAGLIAFSLIIFMVIKRFFSLYADPTLGVQEQKMLALFGALLTYEMLLCLKQGSMIGHANLWMYIIIIERLYLLVREKDTVPVLNNAVMAIK
jgi:hypothetical protein